MTKPYIRLGSAELIADVSYWGYWRKSTQLFSRFWIGASEPQALQQGQRPSDFGGLSSGYGESGWTGAFHENQILLDSDRCPSYIAVAKRQPKR